MLKKIFSNQSGITFIELMIAIAIIVIISMVSVLYIQGDVMDEVEIITDQLAADVRQARNLAVSNTIYDFSVSAETDVALLGSVYPPGGYGVYINKTTNSYIIFADSGIDGIDAGTSPIGYDADKDMVITSVSLENSAITLGDLNSASAITRHFTFKSEKEVNTNLTSDTYGKYEINVDYAGPGWPTKGYRGILSLGERDAEGNIWVSLGKGFEEYNHTQPDPAPKEDPIRMIGVPR